MNRRAFAVLVLAVSAPASAQLRVTLGTPSAPGARVDAPAALQALGGFAGAVPLLATSALTPAFAAVPAAVPSVLEAAAPSAALAPAADALSARPAASSQAPFDAAASLAAKLAAVPADAVPALSAAFDGRAAAPSAIVDSERPRTPEEFALAGRRLFDAVRRRETRDASGVLPEEVPSDGDLRGRLDRLPGTNPERERYVVDLFKLAGARAEDVVLQDIGRGKHNIMVVKKGRTDRVIVVGGHHDKVEAGMGAIDNGTGSTMVANLYQALRDEQTDATIVFVAFGREEEGLLGSEAYLRALPPEQRSKIDAMVNLDTLGVDGTFSWKNNSTRALLDRVAAVAAQTHHGLVEAHLDGGDADSSSFRAAGIPAITIYGASEDVIFDIIHTGRDTMAAFDLGHYKNAYLLTLELLKSLDREKIGPVGRGRV